MINNLEKYLNSNIRNIRVQLYRQIFVEFQEEWMNELRRIFTCENCFGRCKRQAIHHIDGNHKNNSESNIMVVCWRCHPKMNGLSGILKGKPKLKGKAWKNRKKRINWLWKLASKNIWFNPKFLP